jgi:polyisoprenoid-binding protein YceI
LATDNNFRNRALNNQILETGDYEFITFTPTAIVGLPDSVENGQSVTFRLVGDLTIRDITNQATFDVEATLVSDTELTGTASTIVTRADYDLNIPSVPNVANVEEEVELYIDFAISN